MGESVAFDHRISYPMLLMEAWRWETVCEAMVLENILINIHLSAELLFLGFFLAAFLVYLNERASVVLS